MAEIALVQCPAFGIDRPPLALAYLGAVLREYNYSVSVFDFNIDLYCKIDEENKKLWEFQYVFQWMNNNYLLEKEILSNSYFKRWAEQVLAKNPCLIGFSIQSSSLVASIMLAKMIKSISPDTIIVFGGPLHLSCSVDHANYLLGIKNDLKIKVVDAVVLGEGEYTLLDLARRIESKQSLKGCLGSIIQDNGTVINNGLRDLVNDLDSLPFPEFEGFPSCYKFQYKVPMLASRGCVHKCIFCDDTLMWQRYRFRSATNVFKEILLRKQQNIEFIEFNDLLINGNLMQLSDLCDLLINERVNISWGASASIDNRMDLKMLEKLKKAGCCHLNYGIESAAPNILRQMNKGFRVEDIEQVVRDTYKAGISVCTNWIVGFPTETEDDFRETINFIKSNIKYLKNNIMVNSFILKHNSVLFHNKEKFGVVLDDKESWSSQSGVNTIQERKRRYDELVGLIDNLGDAPSHKTFQK